MDEVAGRDEADRGEDDQRRHDPEHHLLHPTHLSSREPGELTWMTRRMYKNYGRRPV
jgi:hypothetical protein